MQSTTEQTAFHSRIIKTDLVEWEFLQFIQQEGFKLHSQEDKARLKESFLNNHFIEPFYVWLSPEGIIYCLDGYHRIKDLKELRDEGVSVPDHLPATFIDCKDKADAAKLVLLYSSQYATVTPGGFESFLQTYNMDEQLMKIEVSIPGITGIDLEFPDELIGEPKDKPITMKITFDNVEDLDKAKTYIEQMLVDYKINYLISVSAGEI